MTASGIAIVVDSTANIPPEYRTKHNFHVIPLRVNWPGEELESLKDLKDLEPAEFYRRLETERELPTTAQPSPGEFAAFFKEIGKDSKEIIAILISDKLSGTLKSAQFALNMVEDLKIEVVDSKNTGMGLGLLAIKAAEAVQQGKSLAEVAKIARDYVEVLKTWFVVDTLKYLHKGGRVSATKKLIGTLLDMKPLLHVVDGTAELFGTVRSTDKALSTMLDLIEVEVKSKKNLWVGISHAANPKLAAYAESEVRRRLQPKVLITNEFSPVVAVHLGPGALGIAHLGD